MINPHYLHLVPMPQSQRKRPYPPTPPSTRSSTLQKRQRLDYDTYAGLSTLWLTKNALRSLDEHNNAAKARASISAPKAGARPPTPPPSPRDILRQVKWPSPGLKHFSRHGGPDLRDIFQVSMLYGRSGYSANVDRTRKPHLQ